MGSGIDRFLLGTNPLLGVDHLDRAKARARKSNLDSESRLRVIEASFAAGAQGLTFTVNPETHAILSALKKRNLRNQIGLYPLLPDIQAFRKAISEGSATIIVRELLRDLGQVEKAVTLLRGGISLFDTNPLRLIRIYIDIEIKRLTREMPTGAKLKAVLVHEIITDMAIALNAKTLMKSLLTHLDDDVGVIPGFATRNLGRFVEVWRDWGFPFDRIVIMTPINKIGFQMTPSREHCEQTLEKLAETDVIAMSPLAAGRLSLTEGVGYLQSLRNLASVAIGVSSESQARETFGFLNQAMG